MESAADGGCPTYRGCYTFLFKPCPLHVYSEEWSKHLYSPFDLWSHIYLMLWQNHQLLHGYVYCKFLTSSRAAYVRARLIFLRILNSLLGFPWLVNGYRYRKILYSIYKPHQWFTWKTLYQQKLFVNPILHAALEYKLCGIMCKT